MSKSKKKTLIIISAAAIIVILFFIFLNLNKNNDEDITDDNVLEIITEPETQELATEPEVIEPEIEFEPEIEEEPVVIEVEDMRTPTKVKRIYQNTFDELRGRYNNNQDIIGIVKIPGTVIFYPVVHYAHDANEYYLDRNYYKQRSAAGSIFMDFENSVDRQDPNTILYGHQMSSNSMFHSIGWFANQDYFNARRYVIFNTIYENSVWEVFAFLEADISFNYIQVYFRSERQFLRLAREIASKSHFDTGIEIDEGDRILILSTCTNRNPEKRYVLAARLVKNKDDVPEDILNQMNNAIVDFLNK